MPLTVSTAGSTLFEEASPPEISLTAATSPEASRLLTPQALAFVGQLHQRFEASRQKELARRRERQAAFDAGQLPDFLPETLAIREASGS